MGAAGHAWPRQALKRRRHLSRKVIRRMASAIDLICLLSPASQIKPGNKRDVNRLVDPERSQERFLLTWKVGLA